MVREAYAKPEARVIDLGNELDEASRLLDEAARALRTARTQWEELGQRLEELESAILEQNETVDQAKQAHARVTAALDLRKEA